MLSRPVLELRVKPATAHSLAQCAIGFRGPGDRAGGENWVLVQTWVQALVLPLMSSVTLSESRDLLRCVLSGDPG